jgi:hypothetical protein
MLQRSCRQPVQMLHMPCMLIRLGSCYRKVVQQMQGSRRCNSSSVAADSMKSNSSSVTANSVEAQAAWLQQTT